MGFFSKLLKLIAIVLAVIMIVYAILAVIAYLGAGGAIATAISESAFALGVGWGWFEFAVVALLSGVISAAISPEGFDEVVEPLVDGASKVASTIADATVDVASSAVGAVIQSPLFLLLAGGYFLLSRKGSKNNVSKNTKRSVSSAEVQSIVAELERTR